jgi:hypothetical protein
MESMAPMCRSRTTISSFPLEGRVRVAEGGEDSRLGGDHQRRPTKTTRESEEQKRVRETEREVGPVDIDLTSREPLAELNWKGGEREMREGGVPRFFSAAWWMSAYPSPAPSRSSFRAFRSPPLRREVGGEGRGES